MKPLLFILGTRPEAIKLAPLILAFKHHADFEVKVCVTQQHKEMLAPILDFFGIIPEYSLDVMRPNQDLFDISIRCLSGLKDILSEFRPDLVFVQGDTTTTFIGSLAAFYSKCKVAHIEAGLRTGHKHSPFPEEINRILTSHIADFHFAPTEKAVQNLNQEGITQNVWNVGNTVVDALLLAVNTIESNPEIAHRIASQFTYLDPDKKMILLTCHRRENHGAPIQDICEAIKEIASQNPDVQIVYPVHMNPNIQGPVRQSLSGIETVFLIDPVPYPELVWLMKQSYFIVSDSGGIQEEAPVLGKPVLVLREETEREEGIDAGVAKLVGHNKHMIIDEVSRLLKHSQRYTEMSKPVNPYGDGEACSLIKKLVKSHA